MPEGQQPFGYDEIRQWALEGLLVLAGHMPGKASVYGRLESEESKGGERFIQRSVDMYTAGEASHAVQAYRASKRGGGEGVDYLTVVDADGSEWRVDEIDADGMESAWDHVPGGVRSVWPCAYLRHVVGLNEREAISVSGLSMYHFRQAYRLEKAQIAEWAEARRLLAA